MKTYLRNKSLEELQAQCDELGLLLDRSRYDKVHSDFIVVEGGRARVLFNTFNGRFFGVVVIDGVNVEFTSDDSRFENEEWFQTLLDFFYSNEEYKT